VRRSIRWVFMGPTVTEVVGVTWDDSNTPLGGIAHTYGDLDAQSA
jgi:hypothetical protein